MNNLVTSTLVLDGVGGVREYVGGYDDWVRQSQAAEPPRKPAAPLSQRPILEKSSSPSNAPRKLTFNEQRALEAQKTELDGLPLRIEALEVEQRQLTQAMGDATFYQQDPGQIAQAARRIKEIEEELAEAYRRWEELSGLLEG